MTCDYCGKALSCADNPRNAPDGLPLFVCSKCYEQLKKSKVYDSVEVRDPVPMGRVHRVNSGNLHTKTTEKYTIPKDILSLLEED